MSVFFNIVSGSYYFMGGLGRQAPGGSFVFLIGKGNESRLFGGGWDGHTALEFSCSGRRVACRF